MFNSYFQVLEHVQRSPIWCGAGRLADDLQASKKTEISTLLEQLERPLSVMSAYSPHYLFLLVIEMEVY